MTTWEDRLASWTGPASDSEDEKRQRTERQIKEAIRAHPRLSQENLSVYAKGSYANNTNVRADSDVDIAVEYRSGFYAAYGRTVTQQEAGVSDYTGPYTSLQPFGAFKTDVHQALSTAFGPANVQRRRKCITVSAKATTLPADVVACWEHRTYYRDRYGRIQYEPGTVLYPDEGFQKVINYPQQHYDNGIRKNIRTHRRYKGMVRAMKRLENDMVDKGAINEVPSYLIECLVYRCRNQCFINMTTWLGITKAVIATIYEGTGGPEPQNSDERWLEVNDIKYLFHPYQKWNRQQANGFAFAAWNYLGLGT